MDIGRLKQETSIEHERVEQSMRVMDPNLDRAAYTSTLQSLYGFVQGWEQWVAAATCPTVQTLCHSRRRSELLRADLRHLSVDLPPQIYPGPALSPSSTAQVFGGMYVMEGSTLGGQYIARHVEATLAFKPGVGDAFFRGYGEATGSMWSEFKCELSALPEAMTDEVIFGAKTLFRDFALWNKDEFTHSFSEPIFV